MSPSDLLPAGTLPLGFGCAFLPGAMGPAEAARLVEAALEAGITYFDTARMYGTGQAESVLGRITPTRRDRMILVSKAGILPPSRALPARLGRKGLGIARRLPGLRGLRVPGLDPRFGAFDPPTLRRSVETSLRELRTDHLDILLLHEVQARHLTEELLALLREMRREGLIGTFGTASDFPDTAEILRRAPEAAPVVQIPASVWDDHRAALPDGARRLVVTHSCLGPRFRRLAARLAADPALAETWSRTLDVDVRDPARLGALFLGAALRGNEGGMVLFSSTRLEAIRANGALAKGNPVDSGQAERLRALVRLLP